MKKELLKIQNFSAGTAEKEILKNINLNINYGEVHVLMGPNGSGKTTLANLIMANPKYEVKGGDLFMDGKSIIDLSTDKRARLGLFMSFQAPLEVSGISVENFIRTVVQERTEEHISFLKFREKLYAEMDELEMDHSYGDRYLNVGFSGGERKKNEILQLLMINPKLAILDETDSGLDVDATRIVAKGIEKFHNEKNSVLIITHHQELVRNVEPDFVHVLIDGKIVKTGDANLVKEIESNGFGWIKEELKIG